MVLPKYTSNRNPTATLVQGPYFKPHRRSLTHIASVIHCKTVCHPLGHRPGVPEKRIHKILFPLMQAVVLNSPYYRASTNSKSWQQGKATQCQEPPVFMNLSRFPDIPQHYILIWIWHFKCVPHMCLVALHFPNRMHFH